MTVDPPEVRRLNGEHVSLRRFRPADEATLLRLVDLHAAGANGHQREMFAASLRAALTLGEVRALVAGLGLDPAAVRQTTDRHWTWATRKPAADGQEGQGPRGDLADRSRER